MAASSRLRSGFLHLKAASWPNDLHHGAVIRKYAVGEGDLGPCTFEQRAGDKHAQTEATAHTLRLFRFAPPRQIGLTDALEQIGRNSRTVVGNNDFDGFGIPP